MKQVRGVGVAAGVAGAALRGDVRFIVTSWESFASTDLDGRTHHFLISTTRGKTTLEGNEWPLPEVATLEIHITTKPDAIDTYFAAFHEIAPGLWRSVMVNNRAVPAYRGKGITASLYRWVAATTGGVVQSSSNKAGMSEYRTSAVDRVWCSLFSRGEAVYDAAEDRLYHPHKPKQ